MKLPYNKSADGMKARCNFGLFFGQAPQCPANSWVQ